MKLVIANIEIPDGCEKMLRWTFDEATRFLGINTDKVNVLLYIEPARKGVYDNQWVTQGGGTDSRGVQDGFIRISLSSLPPEMMVKSLSHELVHVAQIVRGMLGMSEDGCPVWNGRTFPRLTEAGYQAYLDCPWEREARELGKIIEQKVMRS